MYQLKNKWMLLYIFVDREGSIMECIIGVEHVANTSSLSLKAAIKSLFSRYGLNMSCVNKIMMEQVICEENSMNQKFDFKGE